MAEVVLESVTLILKQIEEDNADAVIITGPTASGKSDLALHLALSIRGEIINADVGQFYEPLTIGTAKPDWRTSPVRHHLFDRLSSAQHMSVACYRAEVGRLIAEIKGRNNIPIIVGGSLFYIKSLFFAPKIWPDSDKMTKDEYSLFCDQLGTSQEQWEHLVAIDPKRAHVLNQRDIYRVKRALEIWYRYGVLPSLCQPLYDPICFFSLFYVQRSPEDLQKRIYTRTLEMLRMGWLDEVNSLLGSNWESFLMEKGLIGYGEIITFLRECKNLKDLHKDDIINLSNHISRATYQYAKRQDTFWRSFVRQLVDIQDLYNKPIVRDINV